MAGEAAFLSRDAAGLRQASLTGGRFLKTPDVEILPALPAYAARIRSVDFARLRLHLAPVGAAPSSSLSPWERGGVRDAQAGAGLGDVPPPRAGVPHPTLSQRERETAAGGPPWPSRALAGQYFEVGNGLRKTGYTVPTLETRDGASSLVLDSSIELFRSRAMFVYDDVVRLATARFLPHGGTRGLTATDESYGKVWRAEALPGGNRWNGFGYKLSGAPVQKSDFPPGSGLVIHELGPGDTVSAATYVGLLRRAPGLFAAAANVRFSLRLKGAATVSVSADGRAWSDASAKKDGDWLTLDLDPDTLGTREFHLRAK